MLTFIPLLGQTEQWLHQRHLAAALSNAMPHDKMNSRNSTYCNYTVDKVLELIQNSIHIGIFFLHCFSETRSCLLGYLCSLITIVERAWQQNPVHSVERIRKINFVQNSNMFMLCRSETRSKIIYISMLYVRFLDFMQVSKSKLFFSNLKYDCSKVLDLRNLQE